MKDKWTIQISAAALQGAAENRQRYHQQRAAWWAGEQSKAEKTLREKGIDIREYQQTGGARMQAILDPDLANRLSECQGKVKHHSTQSQMFVEWSRFFAAMPDSHSLDVEQQDFAFFHVGEEAPENG